MTNRDGETGSMRSRLRRETRQVHAALDRMLARRGVFSSLGSYLGYLHVQHDEFVSYEGQAGRVSSEHGLHWWPGPVRSSLIQDDINGLTPEVSETGSQPRTKEACPAGAAGLPEFAGRSYVMEGSQLGGPFILKMLRKSDVLAEEGFAFLMWTGTNDNNWQRYCAWLDTLDLAGSEEERAIRAAHGTFQRYIDLFDGGHETETTSGSRSRRPVGDLAANVS